MLYVNERLVTEANELEIMVQQLKDYLFVEKLIIIKDDQEPMSQDELTSLLINNSSDIYLVAIHISVLLRDFKEELAVYIQKVEKYVEDMREIENFSGVLDGFVQVTEAILEFTVLEQLLQKNLIDKEQLNEVSAKALLRAEEENYEYVLDLLEYELLSNLQHIFDEIIEVM